MLLAIAVCLSVRHVTQSAEHGLLPRHGGIDVRGRHCIADGHAQRGVLLRESPGFTDECGNGVPEIQGQVDEVQARGAACTEDHNFHRAGLQLVSRDGREFYKPPETLVNPTSSGCGARLSAIRPQQKSSTRGS